jgi:two-component system response regulator VanR
MHEDLSILKRLSILLVEDNAIMRKEVSDMLRLFFRDVFIAENGESAFCCYEDEKPDIVLSDIKMPLMDGVTLARKIRQNDFETPIVLLFVLFRSKYSALFAKYRGKRISIKTFKFE